MSKAAKISCGAALGLFFLAAVGSLIWLDRGPKPLTSSAVETPPQASAIAYDPHGLSHPLKTAPSAVNGRNPTNLYSIGTFTAGPFSGDKLGLVIGSDSDSAGTNGAYSEYAYLVLSATGTPIAYDDTLDFSFITCAGIFYPSKTCALPDPSVALGISDSTSSRIEGLPGEFYYQEDPEAPGIALSSVSGTGGALFQVDQSVIIPTDVSPQGKKQGMTDDGFPIIRVATSTSDSDFSANFPSFIDPYQYYEITPFGASIQLYPGADFLPFSYGTPRVSWLTGSTSPGEYVIFGGVGWQDCLREFSYSKFASSLAKTGVTESGSPVYEISPAGNEQSYNCLYQLNQRSARPIKSYSDFLASHPLIFWKHPYGEWVSIANYNIIAN